MKKAISVSETDSKAVRDVLDKSSILCKAATLGKILGVTDRRVRQLTQEGVLKACPIKAAGMHYRLNDSVQSFLNYQRETLIKGQSVVNSDYESARARRMKALAAKEELGLKAMSGEYYPAKHIDFAVTSMLTHMKQRLLAIPSRVTRLLLGVSEFKKAFTILDDEIRAALNALSETNFKEMMDAQQADAERGDI